MPVAVPGGVRRVEMGLWKPVWSIITTMQTVQVVLDEPLLQATDRAAKRSKVNRSALVREALRSYLKMLETRERESRDRAGYERRPDSSDDLGIWEQAAAWPGE